jgi:hypothetical protein
MASVVDICNEAMDLLGASTITSLTENSKEGRLCNRRFESARNSVIRSHPWNTCIRRAAIPQDSEAPAFGFLYQYTLPTDPYCERVISFWNDDVNNELAAYDSPAMFKIEGRKILTNQSTCKITYLAIVTDTEQYDSLLRSVIAYRLAAETSYAITGSTSVTSTMQALYTERMREARSIDAMEGVPEQIVADDFINIRF